MPSRVVKRRKAAATPAPVPQPRTGDVITVVAPVSQAPDAPPQARRPRQCQQEEEQGGQSITQQRVERYAANNAELRANARNILTMIHECRPKNTVSSYEPKQEEFREFCRRKQYSDGDAVTEDKLLLFLVEEVANRPLKTK
ncbi:hypothetical protein P885DRAFT_81341, partial [Corynascus similis CBS 632.67]